MIDDYRITLRNKGFIRNADGSYSKPDKVVAGGACANFAQQDAGHRSLGAGEVKKEGPDRCLLRFTAFRNRLLDPDNNIFKWECDALRYAGIISDDSADHVEIVTRQVKVASKAEEGTEIIIQEIL